MFYGATHCGIFLFFFFNDTATTEIYTLSLHDALPICQLLEGAVADFDQAIVARLLLLHGKGGAKVLLGKLARARDKRDRKSTRLNSSHGYISYAVFCLKKKKPGWEARQRNERKTRSER